MKRETKPRQRRYELYVDEAGEHRWRLMGSNGREIRNCGEGYENRGYCLSKIYDDAKGETNYCIVELKADGTREPILPMH